ncbi:MAG: hypothetical protein GWO24_24995, partial [Akkermansiaceae bacterium]|nr:hypothetical protein [Akkermansiaceae bacterium]
TLTAGNAFGSETAQVTVEVVGPNLVWDFEGRVEVEGDPLQDRLYDRDGNLKFHLVTPGDAPPGSGNTFDRFEEGIPTNPVRYDA